MRLNRTVGLLAGTTALSLGGICAANGGADNDALAQIAELKRELAEMKAKNSGEGWLTEQRAEQIRGVVQDVLADAETRSSFQSSGATAGYNNGFFISSPDGNFSLKVNGLVQARWILNSAKDQNTQWGFDVRRARLTFSGNVSDFRYEVQGQWGSPLGVENGLFGVPTSGPNEFNLLNAYVERDFDLGGNTLTVTAGQFKAPFLREWLVDAGDLMAVDYSLLTYYFYQGYSVGVMAGMSSDDFRVNVAFTNGVGTPQDLGIGSYGSGWNSNPTQYSFAGRAEYKMSGNWADFDNFSSRRGEAEGLMIGVGGLFQKYNTGFSLGNRAIVTGVTADVTWNFGGASIFAALVYENLSTEGAGSNQPWGFMVQGGYFVTDDVEIFARYDYANADVPGGDVTKLSVITAGANYFLSDNAKFTADFGFSLNTLGIFDSTSAGYRDDTGNNDGQFALRAQLQLTF